METIATENVLIDGTRIANGVYGEGEPVVLIHGTPSSSLIWRNIFPNLVTAGFKVHVFDLLGYGLSERPWDLAIDTPISGQVQILEGLLSHWGLDTAHIVAHDIGGGIAQRSLPSSTPSGCVLSQLTIVDGMARGIFRRRISLWRFRGYWLHSWSRIHERNTHKSAGVCDAL